MIQQSWRYNLFGVRCFVRQLRIERVADDSSDGHDRAENDEVLRGRLHQRVDDVGRDEEFETEQEVVAEHLPQLAALAFYICPAHGGDFGAKESHDPAQHAEDNHQHTEDADPKRGMMEVFHWVVHAPKGLCGTPNLARNSLSRRIMQRLVGAARKTLHGLQRKSDRSAAGLTTRKPGTQPWALGRGPVGIWGWRECDGIEPGLQSVREN